MKEAKHIYPGLSKQLSLIDESHVRANGGILTNSPTFSNGVASFVAVSSQKITYPVERGIQTILIKLVDVTSFYMKLSATRSIQVVGGVLSAIGFTSATYYVDGEVGTSIGTNGEITIVDTVTFDCDDIQVGYDGSTYGTFGIDLAQLFIRDLTPSEIYNLYHNVQNTPLPPVDGTLLDYSSLRGTINCKYNTPISTNISFKDIGKSMSAYWNGVDSKLDTLSKPIGVKAFTAMFVINPYSAGENNFGKLIDNGKLILSTLTGARLQLTSDGFVTTVATPTGDFLFNKIQFAIVTRDISGVVNFYIADLSNPPTLSGSADQNSGTPVVGTTDLIIGNNYGSTRTFDGLIPEGFIVEGILSENQMTQWWSNLIKYLG